MSHATYVYGLVFGARKPSLRGMPAGVPGAARARVVRADRSLWAIVSTVPLAQFGEAAIARGLKDLTWVSACAVGHERVVERLLGRGTVVPMKLFTIFSSDARAIEHLARERRSIEPLVRRLRGRVELGVRVSLAAPAPRARAAPRVAGGAAYLRAKQTLHAASAELRSRARDRVEGVFDALAGESAESRRRPVVQAEAGGRVLLDAAYLVSAARLRRFQSTARALAKTLADEGYRLTLTGPWPAYNFIEDRR